MIKEQSLVKRPESLPQRKYTQNTFWDLFLDILQSKGPPIELPDFWIPVIDVYESSTTVSLEIEIPGMNAKDFTIRVDGDLINIKGEKRRIEPLTKGKYIRRERRYGLFDRTLRLPSEVHGNKTTTIYEHGVLKITLPIVNNNNLQEKHNEKEPEFAGS
jgi:HSP20 family molecular chaperone IbpA